MEQARGSQRAGWRFLSKGYVTFAGNQNVALSTIAGWAATANVPRPSTKEALILKRGWGGHCWDALNSGKLKCLSAQVTMYLVTLAGAFPDVSFQSPAYAADILGPNGVLVAGDEIELFGDDLQEFGGVHAVDPAFGVNIQCQGDVQNTDAAALHTIHFSVHARWELWELPFKQ